MSDIIVIQPTVTELTVTEDINQVVVSSVGVQGAKGDTGATGATGATGPTGSSGVVTVNAPLTNAGTSSAANLSISAGTTSAAGALQLTDSVASTSTTTAATPNAVLNAYNSASSSNSPFTSGYYYRTPHAASISTAVTAVAQTTYYWPFFVSVETTFDRIAVRAGSNFNGTASVRLGIYNSTSGKPSTVLLDAGTVAPVSPFQVYQVTINQTLQPGFYFIAGNSQTAASTNTYYGLGTQTSMSYIGQPSDQFYNTIFYYSQTGVSGAFATATSLNNGTSAAGMAPMLRAL
jgi:hypothetical protein